MKVIILNILREILNIIYIPFKALKARNKIIFLSRQFDYPSLDFVMLSKEIKLKNPNIEIVFLCKKLRKGIINKIKYIGFILLSMYHLATSKKAIIDTYIIQISLLKHKESLEITQIWHAIGAVKKFGYQTIGKFSGNSKEIAETMNMHKNYNYVIATGNRTAEFFSEGFNIELDKIKLIGMPRIDYILEQNDEIKKEFYSKYPELKNKKNVLYVPTFRKDQINNMNEIYEKFDFENYNLVIRYHPLDKTKKNKGNPINEKAITIYDKNINIYDLYKFCDIIITDYSSASLEAAILEKPIYFYLYDIDRYQEDPGLNMNLFEEMPNCTSKKFDEIMNWIREDSYNLDWVREYRDTYFDIDLRENCTQNLMKLILEGDLSEKIEEKIKLYNNSNS